ncbi:MAG: membrane protein insertion efficiency factor YidD [bacterium]|nr:membrane protein insertion efficiency factor YidD [bacterium]
MKRVFLLLIKFYQQHLWFLFPSQCRYNPTCSVYTVSQIKKYGTIYGLVRGVKRILRCNVWFS